MTACIFQPEGRLEVKALAPQPKFDTLADILAALGNIPAHRVLVHPFPGTAEEYHLDDPEIIKGRICELIDGTIVEKAMGWHSEYLGTRILILLGAYLQEHNLGELGGAAAQIRLAEALIRIPDVSFIRWDSVDDTDDIERPAKFYLDHAPDLAVEVLSPSNTAGEMTRKLAEYAVAGVKIVWIVDPETQTVDVFTKAKLKHKKTFAVGDTLDGGKILPGFALPVATIFAKRAPGKGKKTS